MNTRPIVSLACATALAAALGLYGCEGQHAASYIASAKSYMAKGDYKAAAIEAKNALQKEPGNGEARLLLARALLDGGDAAGAETEARKAIDANVAKDDVDPVLAWALVRQGEYAKATKELSGEKLSRPETRADLAIALAAAQSAQGDTAKAQSELDAALADAPGNAKALLLKAQLVSRSGDVAGANKYIDAVLKDAPQNIDALLMKAELQVAERRVDDAQKLLEQAITAHPNDVAPRAALVSLAVATGKPDLAKAQVAKMKEVAPRDLRTLYDDALVAFVLGDTAHARDVTQRLLAARPDNMQTLMLSGLVDVQLASYASAEEKLRRVVQRVPDAIIARRALAVTYLRTGRPGNALETLQPVMSIASNDPTLLRIAGEAYLAQGKATEAESAYEHANSLDKTNVASQVRLAQVRFATGDASRGFSDLEALSKNDASAGQADMALFAAHLKRREFDQALAIVDQIEKRDPKNAAMAENLRGIVYLSKRDLAKARLHFEKALEIQTDFYPAAASLATLDIQEGKLQAARDRYDRLLAKNPKSVELLIASAQLTELSGAPPDQVRAALDKAVAANPTSVTARNARVLFEFRHRDGKAAVAAAQAGLNAVPNTPQLVDLLANAQLLNGDLHQAVDTLTQLAKLQPQNPLVPLRLAELQTRLKDYQAAIDNERKALALQPGLSQAWGALAKTYLVQGKVDAALAEARRLQKEQPDKAIGYALEAEIFGGEKKWDDALAAYHAALKRENAPLLAFRVYATLEAAGRSSEAAQWAAQWIKDHPQDPTLVQALAERDQQRKDYGAAVTGYKRVLAIDPDNIGALNNLAWVLTEQGKPDALGYAEQAHRLAPLNPNVLDTLGWTASRTGDPKRGAQLLKMASALAPQDSEIRLHLAKALVDAGDKAGAKQALTELSKLDKDSPVRIEAEKLLATL
ncbi:MAG TPA: XrtA/PEP-CTERM system TPR-repeat protein PrsT [Casimicrobiaceae bacterium]|nr:XrtA/PEP-CTERM system TPR-repeat protein PrsT [Casimicrobiaceae bacterium]